MVVAGDVGEGDRGVIWGTAILKKTKQCQTKVQAEQHKVV